MEDYEEGISEVFGDRIILEDEYCIYEEIVKKGISEVFDDRIIFEDEYCIHEEIVKDVKESVSMSGVLEKASRFIFAEDLVSYISLKFHGYVYTTKVKKGSEKFEILSYIFSDAIRSAVQFIRWQMIKTKCSSFEIIAKLMKSCKLYFENFVDAILSHYTEKDLTAEVFLCFCVYVAELASKCYTPDFEETLDYAVQAILNAFCKFNEGTVELNKFANDVVNKLKDLPSYPICDISKRTEPEASFVDSHDNSSKDTVLGKAHSDLENDLVESLFASDMKLAEKPDKFEIFSNLESEINSMERLTKYMGAKKNDIFYFMAKDCSEPVKEANLPTNQEVYPSIRTSNFDDFVKEFMNIVKTEASFFLDLYLSHKNQQKPGSQNEKHCINEEKNLKVIKFVKFPKKRTNGSGIIPVHMSSLTAFPSKVVIPEPDLMSSQTALTNKVVIPVPEQMSSQTALTNKVVIPVPEQLSSQTTVTNKIGIPVPDQMSSQTCSTNIFAIPEQLGIKRKCDNVYKNAKFLKTASIVGQDQLLPQNPKVNNKDLDKNFTQTKYASESISYGLISVPVDSQVKQIEGLFTVYKPEGDVNEKNLKILKGDTLSFSEDLLRYVSKTYYNISYTSSSFERYRSFLHYKVSEDVKELVHFLHEASEAVNGLVFDLIKTVEREHRIKGYRKYVAAVLERYADNGLDSGEFLYYSLHFSELASKIYASDLPQILDFAVCSILDAFCCLKEDSNDFDAAIKYVLKHFKTRIYYPCETPNIVKFEKECIDVIVGSLKEITRFCTELEFESFSTNETVSKGKPKILPKLQK